uniref:Uncharacterized protein n=1 Tax=Oryza brachyantha TaxID=4533 RepID=J3MHE7_ORYBR
MEKKKALLVSDTTIDHQIGRSKMNRDGIRREKNRRTSKGDKSVALGYSWVIYDQIYFN